MFVLDMNVYRASDSEQERAADLLRMTPVVGTAALDVGARDGHFTRFLAERFERVVALDLVRPDFDYPRVECVQGDAAEMTFADDSFDFVLCAEVLEHIPSDKLAQACKHIQRVTRRHVLLGVPYKQDLRVGRTTCYACGKTNPPWGHVNAFDEQRINVLFDACTIEAKSMVGTNSARANWLSASLMDFAGNPYGTYYQEEPCIHCGAELSDPPERTVAQRVATRLGHWSRRAGEALTQPHANFMHVLLRKQSN